MKSSQEHLLERNAKIVPWLLMAVVLLALAVSTYFSITPFYEYAVMREKEQVSAAFLGLDHALENLKSRAEILAYASSQDKDITNAFREALNGSSVRPLRRELVSLQQTGRLDFLEILTTKGDVFFSYPNEERTGTNQSSWHMFVEETQFSNTVSLGEVDRSIYAMAAAPLFYEGERLGTLVLGSTIDLAVLTEWSIRLTCAFNLYSKFGEQMVSSLHEKGASIFIDLSKVSADQVDHDGKKYALKSMTLRTNRGEPVGIMLIAKSIDGFYSQIMRILRDIAAFLVPLFLFLVFAIFGLSHSLVKMSANLKQAFTRLEQSFKALTKSRESLQVRISDATQIQGVSAELAQIRTVEELVFLLEKRMTSMLNGVTCLATISLDLVPLETMTAEEGSSATPTSNQVLWKKYFHLSDDGRSSHGFLKCVGTRTLTEREVVVIETLFATATLSLENLLYLKERILKAHVEKEVQIAKDVQTAIMPQCYPVSNTFEIDGLYRISTTLGGDWMGCFFNQESEDSGMLRAYIGDVTGHGVASGLVAATVMSQVYALEADLKESRRRNMDLTQALERLDAIVRLAGQDQFLMSFQIIEIDTATGEGKIVQAAHHLPFVVNCKESSVELTSENQDSGQEGMPDVPGSPDLMMLANLKKTRPHVRTIPARGNYLGLSGFSSREFKTSSFTLCPNQVLVLFTDGCVEAQNPETEKRYSVDRLKRLIYSTSHLTPKKMIECFEKDFTTFTMNQPIQDDITLMVIKTSSSFGKRLSKVI